MFCNWCDRYIPDIEKGTKASISRRFLALIIDPIIVLIFYAIVGGIFGSAGGAEAAIGGIFLAIIIYFIFALWFLSKGMTPGILGLQVVEKNTGNNPGLLRMIIRETFGKFLSGLFLGIGKECQHNQKKMVYNHAGHLREGLEEREIKNTDRQIEKWMENTKGIGITGSS